MPFTVESRISQILASARDLLGVARARCYAMDPAGDLRLVACYGFPPRLAPEDVLGPHDPLVEWVRRHRKASYANSPDDAGPLSALMERERYARVLVAPVFEDSRLLGILELQEKLGGLLFGAADLRRAEDVVARIAAVLREYAPTLTAPEPLAAEDVEALFLAPPARGRFPTPPPLFDSASAEAPASSSTPPVEPVSARPPREPEPTRREVRLFKGFFNALLLRDEVEAVVFSFWTAARGELHVGARRPFADAARESLVRALGGALTSVRKDALLPADRRFHTEYPLGREPGELESYAGLQTSVVASEPGVLLATLVFRRLPGSASEAALSRAHGLIRAALLQAREADRYRASYRSLVNAFLEPGARAYPQLKAHSVSVGALCRRLAGALELPADEVEQLTVAGLLHDVGLKELELPYERLSGRRPLDLEELTIVRKHPVVGAAILERIDFPYAVAPLVRHHHERFDGSGYPDRLARDRIPLGSRVIGIAEAYDALTAAHSYRAPVSRETALEIIASKAGTQFDPDLARRFGELIRSIEPPASEGALSESGS